jgi:hypothetical protein
MITLMKALCPAPWFLRVSWERMSGEGWIGNSEAEEGGEGAPGRRGTAWTKAWTAEFHHFALLK